jgi:ribonuclease HI
MKKKKYYAVRIGRVPGVYETWIECEKQVKRYPGAVYKAFTSKKEAYAFANMIKKYYAVKRGRKPGVYIFWDECKEQVIGYPGAVYMAFDTFDDAYSFV